MATQQQLDRQVVALAKAIREHETGNKPIAGATGELKSRYQFMPGTWKAEAKRILGDANAPLTLENENKVAYTRIKEWKDKGYNPAQVASMWNSGNPDMYAKGNKGVGQSSMNKNVTFNVPAYVNSVYSKYERIKQEEGIQSGNAPAETPVALEQKKPFGAFGGDTRTFKELKWYEKPGRVVGGAAELIIGGAVKAMAKPAGEIVASGYELAGKTAPKWTEGVRLASPEQRAATRYGINQQAAQEAQRMRAAGAEGATFTDVLDVASLAPGGSLFKGTKAVTKAAEAVKAGEKVAPTLFKTAMETGLTGAKWGAGYGMASEADAGSGLAQILQGGLAGGATGFGVGAGLVGVPGVGLSAVKEIASGLPGTRTRISATGERLMNSLIKPLMKDLAYEKNPARGLLKYVGVFNSLNEGLTKTQTAIGDLMTQMKTVMSDYRVSREKLNITDDVTQSFDIAIREAATRGDQTLVNRLYEKRLALTDILEVGSDGKLTSKGKRNLANASPEEVLRLKQIIGEMKTWTGNASEDKVYNQVLNKVYGKLKQRINDVAAKHGYNTKLINEGLSDLITAKKVLEHRDKLAQRQNIINMPGKIGLSIGGITTIFSGGPAGIAAAFASIGAEKLMASPAFKTRLATWLFKASPKEIAQVISKAPNAAEIIVEEMASLNRTLALPEGKGTNAIPLEQFSESTKAKQVADSGVLPQEQAKKRLAEIQGTQPPMIRDKKTGQMRRNPNYFDKSQLPKNSQYFGAIAGVEIDEDGNISYNPEKAAIGMAGTIGFSKMNPKMKAKLVNQAKSLGDDLVKLVEEAKKYKSAEEFVKAQGETVYRGGLDLSQEKITESGISVSKGKNIAEDFVKQKGGKVEEMLISPNAKIANYSDIPNVKFKNLNDYSPELDTGNKQIWQDLEGEYQKAVDWAKENGYDAVKLPLEGETRIINPNVLKTKSQLTDIWNKANEKNSNLPIKTFEGLKNLSTRILEKLKGKSSVSKQFISDLTKQGDVKQVERDLINEALKGYEGNVPVDEFAKKVETELLPLKIQSSFSGKHRYGTEINDSKFFSPKYESIALPSEVRGSIDTYKENIYESPIKTSASSTHFRGESQNYFGHTRIEDMADNKTRRVIEVQSDLYQKGNLDRELGMPKKAEYKDKEYTVGSSRNGLTWLDELGTQVKTSEVNFKYDETKLKEVSKLQQYNDPTAHFRMIREEVKKAAEDGKDTLLFPTGETAMKIEGLGQEDNNFRLLYENNDMGRPSGSTKLTQEKLKVGERISQGDGYNDEQLLITEVLGDGKFRAIHNDVMQNDYNFYQYLEENNLLDDGRVPTLEELQPRLDENGFKELSKISEQYDISGTVDTNNPIYKFYEKEVAKYLKNKYNATQFVDDKGVSWNKVSVKPEYAKMPVEAFGLLIALGTGLSTFMGWEGEEADKIKNRIGSKKFNQAKAEYNADYEQKKESTVKKLSYQKLTEEEKKAVLEGLKVMTQKEVLQKYGYNV